MYKGARWPLIQSVYTQHEALYAQTCTLTIDSVSLHSALSPVRTNVHAGHWFSQCTLNTKPCMHKRAHWPLIQSVCTQHFALYVQTCTLTIDSVSVHSALIALYVQTCTLIIDSVSVLSALGSVRTNVHADHWFSHCTLSTCMYKRARWPLIQSVYT